MYNIDSKEFIFTPVVQITVLLKYPNQTKQRGDKVIVYIDLAFNNDKLLANPINPNMGLHFTMHSLPPDTL